MPVKTEMAEPTRTSAPVYRPPKEVLDIFWTLADGTDAQRTAGTIKLTKFIKETKEEDKEKIACYCRDRLVKGLSSGRKFARIGFAATLAQLLREHHLQVNDVVSSVQEKLKPQRHDKSSKSEVGGIYLGRAFGFSSIVQSGTLSVMKSSSLSAMTEDLLSMADKKSYLKAVCNKTVEDIVSQVSTDDFGEHIWPKLRDKMKQGWDTCTLDILSLLLKCHAHFPDIVNKKFLKKHWGFPILNEENDSNLMKAILDTDQRTEILLEKILPSALASGRTISSMWTGLGEKLLEQLPVKKQEMMAQRQLLALKVASRLLQGASTQQILEVSLSEPVARCLFHSITRKEDPLAVAGDHMFGDLCVQLKSGSGQSILSVVEQLWKMSATAAKPEHRDLVTSVNFTRLLDMMGPEEAEAYADTLMSMIKGKDKWEVLSDHVGRKGKQVDSCLRQLQHLLTCPALLSSSAQTRGMALLVRLAYFKVDKKVKNIQHCETCVNFDEDEVKLKLCESLLFKSLNTISTANTGHHKRSERDSKFLELFSHLCDYIQELLTADKVKPIKTWSDNMQEDWNKLYGMVTKLKKANLSDDSLNSAFLLLSLYLSLQVLADYKTASELLQDVLVCYDKATSVTLKKKKESEDSEEDEASWMEVLTEVLLHLMSLPSHLGRVITATTFRLLIDHMTPPAVGLITEVLIPKKARSDDAGGALVEGDEPDEDEDDDEAEEDVASESSDGDDEGAGDGGENEDGDDEDDDDDDDDEAEEEMDEDVEVDEQFRESVKQALGQAADVSGEEDDEKEMSDLSDSEMFKLDDMLAEVFRQRKKAGTSKKAREEKKTELANFRLRVLDLVEGMIKSDRCGDFLLDVLKPLLLLTMRTNTSESQALSTRAEGLFTQLKSRVRMLKDTVHTTEEQVNFFQELIELAQKTTDPTYIQVISMATYFVMNISCGSKKQATETSGCMGLFQETLSKIISKKQSKPHISFFISIIEMNPMLFQSLSKSLISNLEDENVKVYNKSLCCSVLTSLCKRVDKQQQQTESEGSKTWMAETGQVITQLIAGMQKDNFKAMLVKELLQLMLALQARKDVPSQALFDLSVKQKLVDLKSKFNTDLRRLANKIISAIERAQLPEGEKKMKKKKQKRQFAEVDNEETPKKNKQKRQFSAEVDSEEMPKKKKKNK